MRYWKSLTILTVIFLGIAIFFAPQFELFGAWVIERFGLKGLLVTTFLFDYLLQPFPPDIPLYSYLLGGDGFWSVILFTGLMSVLGGTAGYWTGRLLEYEGAMRFIGKSRYKQAYDLFHQHGVLAIVVAGMTPVPFNAVCWSAGVFKMPFHQFILSAAAARLPRFCIVGLIAVGMG